MVRVRGESQERVTTTETVAYADSHADAQRRQMMCFKAKRSDGETDGSR